MAFSVESLFNKALEHRKEHRCGGYPYEHADLLSVLVKGIQAKRILELGTGLGYSTIFLAQGNKDSVIDTIDQSDVHLALAEENFIKAGVEKQITTHHGKAEVVLKTLSGPYDLIFFDGHAPSMKFLMYFEKLLKRNGLLITANMFVKDKEGGRYMRSIKRVRWWKTILFADTTIAVKI